MDTNTTMNTEEYYRPTLHACVHDVLGLPALIRASVIIFVIVCKVQLSVWFSFLLICAFSSENIFLKLFCCIILAMSFH